MPVSHNRGSPMDPLKIPLVYALTIQDDPQGILRGSTIVWHRHYTYTHLMCLNFGLSHEPRAAAVFRTEIYDPPKWLAGLIRHKSGLVESQRPPRGFGTIEVGSRNAKCCKNVPLFRPPQRPQHDGNSVTSLALKIHDLQLVASRLLLPTTKIGRKLEQEPGGGPMSPKKGFSIRF